jgi:hypothetical protein
MPDQHRREQIEHQLEQSRRLLRATGDPITTERITKLIEDLKHEQVEEDEK